MQFLWFRPVDLACELPVATGIQLLDCCVDQALGVLNRGLVSIRNAIRQKISWHWLSSLASPF